MSFQIRNIREISNDPLTKFVNQLAKKYSKFINDQEGDKLENKEDVYSNGEDVDVVIRYPVFNSSKYFNFTTQYYSVNEPDGDKLRVWIRGRNLGNTMRDFSEEGRIITINGDPVLVDGTPFDDGIHTGGTKSIALRLNRPTSDLENEEYITVNHTTRGRVSEGLSSGISFFIRFRVFSLAQQGGANLTLFEKTDNNPITDGVKVEIDASGRLKFLVENSNVQYWSETATGTIAINTVYDVWFTYTKSGNVLHIYVNNVDKSLSVGGGLSFHDDPTNLDLSLFSRAANYDNGHVYGDLYDFRVYREKIVSGTEVSQMFTNKWTISDIPFGQVMVSNYWATVFTTLAGYTTTGYTTTGYTT